MASKQIGERSALGFDFGKNILAWLLVKNSQELQPH